MPRRRRAEASSEASGNSNGSSEERSHWPGPFATARNLLRERTKARRLREEQGPHESTDDSTTSRPYIPWEPRPEANIDQSQVDDGWCFVPDTYPVQSLTVLCVQFICKHVDQLEALGPITPELRRKISYTLCERQKMNAATFDLLAKPDDGFGGGTYEGEIDIPDCAIIDPHQMQASLGQCRQLRKLSLGHCGRGFTDATALAVKDVIGPSLRILSLRGAYALTTKALRSFIENAEELRQLELIECPQIEMSLIEQLSDMVPKLEHLHINALNIKAQDYVHAQSKPGGKRAKASLASSSSSKEMDQWLSSLPPCLSRATLQKNWTASFSRLRSVQFVQLPQLDDFAMQLFFSAQRYAVFDSTDSFQLALSELVIDGCPLISNASLEALAGSISNCPICETDSKGSLTKSHHQIPELHTLKLSGLPKVTDKGIEQLSSCALPLRHLRLSNLAGVEEEQSIITLLLSHPNARLGGDNRGHSHRVSKSLESVDFASMQISDHTLLTLTEIAPKTLQRLNISWCRQITDDACKWDVVPNGSVLII